MKKHIPAVIILITLLIALPAGIFASHIFAAHAATSDFEQVSTQHKSHSMSFADACPDAPVGQMSCMAMMSTINVQPAFANWAATTAPGTLAPAAIPTGSAAPYSPAALHNAYNLPVAGTTQQTVAIVDAFDDPNAEADLATYRSMFGLAACTTANGCFSKVNQTGGTTYPTSNTSWGGEISLDLDMVSAICPGCHILLVEANSASTTDLGAAVNEAVALGANEVSNSYGAPENATDTTSCNTFYNHPGVVITASSGDGGLGINTPANCPNVVSVGGTTLSANGTETAWNTNATRGAGGGCSAQIPTPTWQVPAITNCATRAIADVSADADPQTGVFVFDTFGQNGGLQFGGTSVSAPIIAAVYALAGGAANVTNAASIPWTKINAGTTCLNTVAGAAYAFQTGLGTPNGTACF